MKRLLLILLLILLLVAMCLPAQQVRFAAIDIYIDSNSTPLAAYQLEFHGEGNQVRIAGIEGGAHDAFKIPPFYDPKAMQQERVILAAFNTGNKLPSGNTRVATIHLQYPGPQPPTFLLKLHTASDSNGKEISVKTTFTPRSAYE